MDAFKGIKAYAHSKLAGTMVFRHLGGILKREGIKVVMLHPGVIRSELARNLMDNVGVKVLYYLIYPIMYYLTKNVHYGAQTTVYCALEEAAKLEAGGYYKECSEFKLAAKATNEEDNKKLFDRICSKIEEKGYSIKF